MDKQWVRKHDGVIAFSGRFSVIVIITKWAALESFLSLDQIPLITSIPPSLHVPIPPSIHLPMHPAFVSSEYLEMIKL